MANTDSQEAVEISQITENHILNQGITRMSNSLENGTQERMRLILWKFKVVVTEVVVAIEEDSHPCVPVTISICHKVRDAVDLHPSTRLIDHSLMKETIHMIIEDLHKIT